MLKRKKIFTFLLVLSIFLENNGVDSFTLTADATENKSVSNNVLNGVYLINNKCSGKVLDIKDNSTEDGAKLQQWAGGNGDNQKFGVEMQEDGYYKITAQHSGKVLDIPYGTSNIGVQLQQANDNGSDAQRWEIIDDGNGYYKVKSKASGLLMDVASASTANGATVQQYTDNGSDAQRWSFTLTSSKIKSTDFLKANGTVLRNHYGDGEIVNLRGTNLGGWLLQEPWMSPCGAVDEWNLRETLTNRFGEATKESLIKTYQKVWLQESDLDNIKNMGMNLVRVPVLYLELMDKNGNWKSDAWENLDWLVSNCSSRGIYVLIDLHGTFGGQNTFDNCGEENSDPQLWKNTLYQDRTVALWEGIAAHFEGNPTVAGYDLLNEPNVVSASQLNTFYNRLYNAIRVIDPDHLICMEAAWDWNQLYAPSIFGWTNVMYELHYYAMADNESNDWDAQNNLIDQAVAEMKNHQSSWNIPVFAGEFCVFEFYDLWEKFYSEMNSINASWSNWTYKVTSNNSCWGFYYNNPSRVPDINNDSADIIATKWNMFSTNYFQPSTTFQSITKKYTQALPAIETPSSPWISIKAEANNEFICAELGGDSPLTARSTKIGDWEKFKIMENNDGTISLQSKANNLYVCADINQSSQVIARSYTISTWEKFKKVDLGNNTFALQAMANNKYVCADLNSGNVLYANGDLINGAWEAFTLANEQ